MGVTAVSVLEANMQKPIATIREARVSDAAALAILAEATFRETFQSSNTKEDMDVHCAEHFGVNIQSAEILTPAITTVVGTAASNLLANPVPCQEEAI